MYTLAGSDQHGQWAVLASVVQWALRKLTNDVKHKAYKVKAHQWNLGSSLWETQSSR